MNSVIKTYQVEPHSYDRSLVLISDLDREEQYTAHPDDFHPGQQVCEHEFVVKRHTVVTHLGMSQEPVAVRIVNNDKRTRYRRRVNVSVLIISLLSLGAIISGVVFTVNSIIAVIGYQWFIALVILVLSWLGYHQRKATIIDQR